MNGPHDVGIPRTDAGGERVKTTVTLNKRKARQLGWDQQVAEPKFLAELDAFGLLNQQRVRSAINGVTVDLFAQDHAADAWTALEEHERYALPIELVSGRQASNPAADDDDGDYRVHPSIITFRGRAIRGRR